MYENITYEVILQRMLDRVPNNIDKREGSIIYNALAPAAVELQNMYIEFDAILNEAFADTATREYLIKRCAERGIYPYEATNAILKGVFNIDVPIGSRFSLDDLNYEVIEKISNGVFKLKCETAGIVGNQHFGSLIPIDYIDGLTSAELVEILIPGEDEEDTEDLRTRYFDTFNVKAYGGNKQDYIQKTNAIAGVGATKVTPVWNGGGTVKLTILNSEFNKASSTLIETVQNEIDPVGYSGKGYGIAPIGHIVTVDTVNEVTINISTNLTFDEGYAWNNVQEEVIAAIEAYLLELRKDWANQSQLIVRISQIETRILAIEGIVDIANTKINNLAQNLTLGEYEIPVLGVISV
jgi:uncharacterized phage protein gp47/JayE